MKKKPAVKNTLVINILIVDKREKDLDDLKRSLFINGVQFKEATLEEGDFTDEEETFIAERKRHFDLFSSVTANNHMYVQLARMREKHPTTPLFILFQGDYQAMLASIHGWQKPILEAFRYKLAHIYGVQFIECFDTQMLIDTLKEIAKYAKGIKDEKPVFESIYMSKNFDERVRNLMSVPHMGQNKAEDSLKKYNSIMNLVIQCEDDPEDVMEMNGFGKGMVENIIKMYIGDTPFIKKINQIKEKETPQNAEHRIAERKKKFKVMRAAYSRRAKKT